MERIKFIRFWPLPVILVGIAVLAVFVLTSSPAQALDGEQSRALQGTPPAPTAPPVTVVPPTVVIPDTGGDTVSMDFFSNWVLWAVLGVVVIALLIALAARPAGPPPGPPPHHHHDDV